jgi:hypothetical protein
VKSLAQRRKKKAYQGFPAFPSLIPGEVLVAEMIKLFA